MDDRSDISGLPVRIGNIVRERGAVMFCEHVPFTSCGQFQELSGRDNPYTAKRVEDEQIGIPGDDVCGIAVDRILP